MYVIAGLGNPGKEYEQTRHNLGFLTIDKLAEKLGISVTKSKFKALIGNGFVGREKVMLVKPQTYMNLSGDSISQVLDYFDIENSNLILIYDDMDIEVGTIRIRKQGGGGTHNGMKSVVRAVGDEEFPRVRIGIGDKGSADAVNYVIGRISKEEQKLVEPAIEAASKACLCIIEEGVDKAMNQYNGKA